MFKTSKKDLVFFDLLSDDIDKTCKAAKMLEDLFTNYKDTDAKIDVIARYETDCDITIHKIIDLLNRSFVTPIDRDDIFTITKVLDDITDNIEAVAQCLRLFSIKKIRPATIELAQLITKCTQVLREAVDELKSLKTSTILHDKIVEVNKLENEGDVLYNKIMKNLFSKETDPIELIKWKEIVETMESTLDACEEAADVLEGIVSKNA